MEIYHRVDFGKEHYVEPLLEKMGIRYETPYEGRIIRFEIAESDENWPAVRQLMAEKGVQDRAFDTEFSEIEILNAEWLRMFGFPAKGYPQPEKKWLREHFNYSFKCKECGTFQQSSSFLLKQEPRMGKYDFMSLHWTSAVFAVPRVFAALETHQIQGYERWSALINKTKEPAVTVTQLYVPALNEPALMDADELKPILCQTCSLVKYQEYHKRGIMYLSHGAIPDGIDMFETYEWFGNGFQPRRELIVSNRVAKLAYAEGWRGLAFKVVELI